MTQAIQSAWTWLRSSDISKINTALNVNNSGIQQILTRLDEIEASVLAAVGNETAITKATADIRSTIDVLKAAAKRDAVPK